jgi:hypothetical protein
VSNWGTEYWSLIKLNGSWKITSVTWTTNLEQLEKCPFKKEDQFVYSGSPTDKQNGAAEKPKYCASVAIMQQ